MSRLLLAFDCSGAACSAALARDGEIVARRFEALPRGQGERLLPMLAEVLAEAGSRYADLTALAVTLGPGSFTGLRIGLAAARALALATGLPIVARSSFQVLAAAARPGLAPGESLVVAIDSQRGDLFVQAFPAAAEAGEEMYAATPSAAAARSGPGPLLLAGSGAERLAVALAGLGRSCRIAAQAQQLDAAVLAALAAGAPLPPAGSPPPSALYLRPPDTSRPRAAP